MEHTPTLLAYLAGIVDGEGHVGLNSGGASGRARRVELYVKMSHEPTIDLLIATFGGGKQFREPSNPTWKSQWAWRVNGRAAIRVISLLSPYLRIKTLPTAPFLSSTP